MDVKSKGKKKKKSKKSFDFAKILNKKQKKKHFVWNKQCALAK